ncbi:unnamed protein product, partial [marine sediment metagenome]
MRKEESMEKVQITVTGKCSGDEDRIKELKEMSPEDALEVLTEEGED